VICNSRLVRDQIRARFGVPESRLHVIYNAVDCARFTPASAVARSAARNVHGLPATATVFALVGSGYDRKGVVRAMAALARQPDDVWLVVAGKEKRLAHYRALAERFGVAARTRLAGALDEIAPLPGAADIRAADCVRPVAQRLPGSDGRRTAQTSTSAAPLNSPAHDAGIACDAYMPRRSPR
jgi:UDP-glucose:(heptosyl)LPS alpha-1,3-glucosyltransferase